MSFTKLDNNFITSIVSRARTYSNSIAVLLFLFCSRLIAMYIVPLNDSTEARYAEIARIMLETGNWVTPMHHYGDPFWAKPPLSIWLSAFSMKIFGVSAFAARLPGFILSLGILWLVWHVANKRNGVRFAINSVLILTSSFYFLLDAGTVMTDPSLLFCLVLSTVAFWHAVVNHERIWSYIFFVGLGLGLLAKGPISLVLLGLPIFTWVVFTNSWKNLWVRLPWFSGILLMLVISLPWYILAEMRTPGFLHYFIVGEHIMRFLQPGWTGDKYGFAHIAPYGMIWAYAALGTLPWSLFGFVEILKHFKSSVLLFSYKNNTTSDGWTSYWLLCALLPLCFFTFASNIIYPYVFPSIPAIALLAAGLIKNDKKVLHISLITGVIFFMASALFLFAPQYVAKSHYKLIDSFADLDKSSESKLIYWTYHIDYSAQFYSSGKAVATLDPNNLCKLLSSGTPNYLVEDNETPIPLPAWLKGNMRLVHNTMILKKHFNIYRIDRVRC